MLCCVGLIGGVAVGQSLGGPWTFIAPAAGFGIGLGADLIFMHGTRKKAEIRTKHVTGSVRGIEVDGIKAGHQVQHASPVQE